MYWFVELVFENRTNNKELKVEVALEDKDKVIELYKAVHSDDWWKVTENIRTR